MTLRCQKTCIANTVLGAFNFPHWKIVKNEIHQTILYFSEDFLDSLQKLIFRYGNQLDSVTYRNLLDDDWSTNFQANYPKNWISMDTLDRRLPNDDWCCLIINGYFNLLSLWNNGGHFWHGSWIMLSSPSSCCWGIFQWTAK